jgi:hypothetical protein
MDPLSQPIRKTKPQGRVQSIRPPGWTQDARTLRYPRISPHTFGCQGRTPPPTVGRGELLEDGAAFGKASTRDGQKT